MGEVINILFTRMPGRIHGASVCNDDGSFTVFLDPNDSTERQMESLRHELAHIENGDFDNTSDKHIQRLEEDTHGYI